MTTQYNLVTRTGDSGSARLPGLALFDPMAYGQLTRHDVFGFDEAIPAICYEGPKLRCGFPLGGLGTGYLEMRPDGTLGRTSVLNDFTPPRRARGTLLSLRRTLDSDDGLIPLDSAHADISVLGHFPVLNMRFALHDGPVVWLRAFSPLIPGAAEASNTPGIVFEIAVDGPSPFEEGGYLTVSLRLGENPYPGLKRQKIEHQALAGGRLRLRDHGETRADLYFSWQRSPEGSGVGFIDDEVALSLYAPLLADKVYRCIFAWHAPWFADTGHEPHRHRYAARFPDAPHVARLLAKNHRAYLARIIHWQRELFHCGEPDWMTHAMVQSLYALTKNALWVDEDHPDRWYGKDGLFACNESFRGSPNMERVASRQHAHLPVLLLWPELERSTLTALAHYQLRSGEIPGSLGAGCSLREPKYHHQHPLAAAQFILQVHRYFLRTDDDAFLRRLWPQLVDAFRFALTLDTDDDGLINEQPHAMPGGNWPSNHFYDHWLWRGTSPYVAGQWLAALRALSALADELREREIREQAKDSFERGQRAFRRKLWNEKYFRLWYDDQLGPNETCLANQLMGHFACKLAGLEGLFDEETLLRVHQSVEKHNARPTQYGLVNGGAYEPDEFERAAAERAAANAVDADQAISRSSPEVDGPPPQAAGIFVAENLTAAMTGMYEDYEQAQHWARRLMWSIHEHSAMPWDQHALLKSDTGRPAAGADHIANLAVWALPLARSRHDLSRFTRRDGWLHHMIQNANTF